jgi:hypothetical protein
MEIHEGTSSQVPSGNWLWEAPAASLDQVITQHPDVLAGASTLMVSLLYALRLTP